VFYDATMAATAADYAWVAGDPAIFEAYCLTLARGLTPAQFLARLGAQPEAPRTGIGALYEPSYDLWADNERLASYRDDRLFIGVTAVPGGGGDWALGVEINGHLGVTPEAIVPLSAGTRVVSHYLNQARDQFYWVEDGDIRLDFEPGSPAYREGSTPDALVDLMRDAGFELREELQLDHPTEAAFALAERLTGVRLTMALLEEASYDCGIARVPE
jgi:Family of unknown function (DUF6461)